MVFWFAFGLLYALVALFALCMTRAEHARKKTSSILLMAGSYGLCLVWPLLVAGMLVAIRLTAPATARTQWHLSTRL